MTWFDVNFGESKAGLATVGYRQYNDTGGDAVARTTTGVVEVGNGAYGVEVAVDPATVGVQWDTGEASPIYANESLLTPAIDPIGQEVLDILEGDHVENSIRLLINRKGTTIPVLDKLIKGSLLAPDVTITTEESP